MILLYIILVIILTLTAVGDVTIGRNVKHSGTSIFDKELKKQNGDVNFIFRNVKDIFESDDVTIVNFEGVLADECKEMMQSFFKKLRESKG